jgi:hypothetical protein
VRPARTSQTVSLYLIKGKKKTRLAGYKTNAKGLFSAYRKRSSGDYQLRWNDGTNEFLGRAARVALR